MFIIIPFPTLTALEGLNLNNPVCQGRVKTHKGKHIPERDEHILDLQEVQIEMFTPYGDETGF